TGGKGTGAGTGGIRGLSGERQRRSTAKPKVVALRGAPWVRTQKISPKPHRGFTQHQEGNGDAGARRLTATRQRSACLGGSAIPNRAHLEPPCAGSTSCQPPGTC